MNLGKCSRQAFENTVLTLKQDIVHGDKDLAIISVGFIIKTLVVHGSPKEKL